MREEAPSSSWAPSSQTLRLALLLRRHAHLHQELGEALEVDLAFAVPVVLLEELEDGLLIESRELLLGNGQVLLLQIGRRLRLDLLGEVPVQPPRNLVDEVLSREPGWTGHVARSLRDKRQEKSVRQGRAAAARGRGKLQVLSLG